MNPRVKKVKTGSDFSLHLIFENDEEKVFDCRAYLEIGIFRELKDLNYFSKAFVQLGTVVWPHEQDFYYPIKLNGYSILSGNKNTI